MSAVPSWLPSYGGAEFYLEIDATQVMQELAAMLVRIQHPQPLLASIGANERTVIQDRILSGKVTPWGAAWAPWMPRTEKARNRKGNSWQGLLWDSGDLVNDIHEQVTGNLLEIGSSKPYAVFLQEGTPNMVAREFLGWEPSSIAVIEDAAVMFLSGMQ